MRCEVYGSKRSPKVQKAGMGMNIIMMIETTALLLEKRHRRREVLWVPCVA